MLAKLLTPFEFGVWGFTQMIIMYFSNLDFGIPSSFNALASIHKNRSRFVSFNFNAAFSLTILVSLLVIILFLLKYQLHISIGNGYNFDKYIYSVVSIIILGYFNKLFMNLFRVYNKLKEITFYQAIVPIVICITYIYFKENLIQNILIGMIIANGFSLIFFLVNTPVALKINFSGRLLAQLQKSGIYFFIYNTSFYFLMLTSRTIISQFYSVEEFGFFNFALSLSNIIELSVSALSFLIFPKMINRLSSSINENAFQTINFMQTNYTMVVSVLTYFSIAFFPLFIHFFPKYEFSTKAFNLILFSNLIYANCFGSPVLLMARKKERKLAFAAFSMLLLNITLTIVLIKLFEFEFSNVVLGLAITYFTYVLLVNRLSLSEIGHFPSFKNLFFYSFPLKLIVPLFAGILLTLANAPFIVYPCLFLLFILLNLKYLIKAKRNIQQVLVKPELIDI